MKKIAFIVLAILLVASPSFAFVCQQSNSPDQSDACYVQVRVADDETNLISAGTVLVYDFTSNDGDTDLAASNVRYSTASAAGVYVAGVAQGTVASGKTAWVLVRGKGKVKVKTVESITSGNALFVSTSGDSVVQGTSTTQNQLGFALETQAASGNTFDTIDAFITIV